MKGARHRFAVKLACGQITTITMEADCGTIEAVSGPAFDPATGCLNMRFKVLCQFPHHNDPPVAPPTTENQE